VRKHPNSCKRLLIKAKMFTFVFPFYAGMTVSFGIKNKLDTIRAKNILALYYNFKIFSV